MNKTHKYKDVINKYLSHLRTDYQAEFMKQCIYKLDDKYKVIDFPNYLTLDISFYENLITTNDIIFNINIDFIKDYLKLKDVEYFNKNELKIIELIFDFKNTDLFNEIKYSINELIKNTKITKEMAWMSDDYKSQIIQDTFKISQEKFEIIHGYSLSEAFKLFLILHSNNTLYTDKDIDLIKSKLEDRLFVDKIKTECDLKRNKRFNELFKVESNLSTEYKREYHYQWYPSI